MCQGIKDRMGKYIHSNVWLLDIRIGYEYNFFFSNISTISFLFIYNIILLSKDKKIMLCLIKNIFKYEIFIALEIIYIPIN